MKIRMTAGWLALLAILGTTACDNLGTATSPNEELTAEDEIALQALQDPLAVQTALNLAGPSTSTSSWASSMGGGMHGGQSSTYADQARTHFETALDAMHAGDMLTAAKESREARMLVAEGMRYYRGDRSVSDMVARMEDLAVTATMDPARLSDAELLSTQLSMLSESARQSMSKGDLTGAGALGVLGEQRVSQCSGPGDGTGSNWGGNWGSGMGNGHGSGMGNGHGSGTGNGHGGWMSGGTQENVELTVALGSTAVGLATDLLTESGADEEQQSYLIAADEAQLQAEEALLAGDLAQARYLAGLAQSQALQALVAPGGITADEVQAMLELAQALFEDAIAAVGDTPTELQADLLARVDAMVQMALSNLNTWGSTSIYPLWRAAVISAFLVEG